jgi:Mg-chelatase subunit ChlD
VAACATAVAAYLLFIQGAWAASTQLVPTSDKSNQTTGWEISDSPNTDCGSSGTLCTERIEEDIATGSPDSDSIRSEATAPTNDDVEFEITDLPVSTEMISGFNVTYRARRDSGSSSTLIVQLVDGVTVLGSPPTTSLGSGLSTYSYQITGLNLTETQGNNLFIRLRANGNRRVTVTAVNITPIYTTTTNPTLGQSCGVDMALVLDSSGSIDSTELAQMKTAMNDFVDAFLPATPTQIAVVDFDSSGFVTQGFTNNVTDLQNAINATTSGGFTNWDDALYDARTLFPNRAANPDLIVFATDGNPTARFGHPPNPTPATSVSEYLSMLSAIEEADAARGAGTRIISLGIGNDLDTNNLIAVSSSDAVYTSGFSTLADTLADLAEELCGGTITVHKVIDADGDTATTGDQTDGAGWTFTTNVDAPDTSTPASGPTDGSGMINFDISLGGDQQATVDVTETVQSGYTFVSASCTSDSNPIGTPSGLSVNNITLGQQDIVSCTFYNRPDQTFTVYKDFIPNNAGNVTVALSCTSGTATPASATAAEGSPAVFTVSGMTGNPTCTATESAVPPQYTQTGSCSATLSFGFCTITNTISSDTFTVNKDFQPDLASPVTVTLSCGSGVTSPGSLSASESSPATFSVTGFVGDPVCTATESPVPAGYSSSGTCSALLSVGSCTIVNTLNTATFTVNKDFSDNNAASVTVSLSCASGNTSPASISITETSPGAFTVSGYSGNPSCTAVESSVPTGYTSSGQCVAALNTGSCTIVNTVRSAQLNVLKDFSDDNSADVTVSVTCTSGTVANIDTTASEADAANFQITYFNAGATCTATEVVPAGYTANQSACVNVAISHGGTASCTIVNNLNTDTFVVSKDFSDNNAASVTVSLSCTSGSDTPATATASEATPATFTVTGFSGDPTCTATESPVPAGYSSGGTCSALLSVGVCTIVNTLNTDTFTVVKDFSDNSAASVTVSLSCTSGSDSPATDSASESTPATFTVSGFSGDPTCTATESPVPAGYSSSGICSALLSVGTCTISNTLNTDTFTVVKDFSDNNAASVTVSLSCTSGSDTPATAPASESTPATFTVSGFSGDPTCTATESPVPAGYSSSGTCSALLSVGTCTITNTLNTDTFTVVKDFSDNNAASVTVSLACTSGTDSPATASASEATPATFTVSGYSGDPTCTATELLVPGYSSSGSCSALLSVGTCTIVNTLNTDTFTVVKDFSDDSAASVTVSLSCTSGTDSPASAPASESTPAVFTVSGFSGDPTCTATESPVPGGYSSSGTCSALLSVGACTIVNTLNTDNFTVVKDFSDNNAASVTVSLSCTSGTDSPATASASESTPATFTVSGYSGDPTCTATESPVPAGYSSGGTCSALLSVGTCTITNTLNTDTFTVNKDFSDDNAASVTVSLSCTSGNDSPATAPASEATPATFTVSGFSGDPTCTATESPVPGGYSSSGTCSALLSVGACTIVNTLNAGNFNVIKDFSPDDSASVTVSLSCTSGTDSPATASASESSPGSFTVSGYTGDPTCTATESPIPSGYTASGTPAGTCSALLSVGSCVIVNTLNTDTFTVNKDFSDDNAASVTVSLSCTSGSDSPATASASEATPATFTVSGYTGDPTCTATEMPVPGYSSSGTCSALLSVGTCTIVNTLNTDTFTVVKDFSDNNAASVTVSLACTSGTDSPATASASEATPATFTVSGYSGDPTCTATEMLVPGYSSSGTCSALLSVGTCTIVNTLNTDTFTVVKDFSDNNAASVTVSLSCSSGSDSPATAAASEATPATFTVSGFFGDPTCTATESPVPGGYSSSGTCAALLSVGTCTIVNTLNADTFTVNKNFSDDSAANVTVSLSCTSGTDSPATASASESTPATFTISGYSGDPTCTATESPVPSGYSSSGTCSALLSVGTCTITNTLNVDTFTVDKDFSDDNAANVTVSLSCTSGSDTPATAPASESTPATFTVSGYSGDPTCTATESPVPGGYTSSGACSALLSVGTCTITNTLNTDTFTVNKNFSDNNPASVTVSLSCASGSDAPATASASEATPATFTVSGYTGDPTCTATESPIPSGYTASGTPAGTCSAPLSVGSCTITNTLVTNNFTVAKDFVPNNAATVTVSLSCASGTASPATASASEATPASFTVAGASGNPTCTATESPIPGGYSASGTPAGTCAATLSAGTCTITNTLNTDTFIVYKDFSDNSSASVTVSVVCAGASVTPATATASEATPATFTVSGFTGDPSCTATESPVPGGYTSAPCTAALSAGSCTIVNTRTGPLPTPGPGPVGGAVDLPVSGSGGSDSAVWILLLLLPVVAVIGGGTWFARKR